MKPESKVALKDEVKQAPHTLIAANKEDVYIAQLAASQPNTLEEAEDRDIVVKEGTHRLTLPMEVQAVFKKSRPNVRETRLQNS